MSGGSGVWVDDATAMAPHRLPATTTGTPTPDVMGSTWPFQSRSSQSEPCTRAGRAVWWTRVAMLWPPSGLGSSGGSRSPAANAAIDAAAGPGR